MVGDFDVKDGVVLLIESLVIVSLSSLRVTCSFKSDLVTKLLISVLQPWHVLLNDTKSSFGTMGHPHLVVICPLSKFSFGSWDRKLMSDVVSCISSCNDLEVLFRWSDIFSCWELSISSNFLEYVVNISELGGQNVWELSVKRNEEHVTSTVEVIYKFEFVFMLSNEVSHCSCFWLRESLWSLESLIALVLTIVSLAEVVSPVSVQVNSCRPFFTLVLFIKVEVLSLIVVDSVFEEVFLDEIPSIDVNSWDNVILVLNKHIEILLVVMNDSTMDEFEHREQNHR